MPAMQNPPRLAAIVDLVEKLVLFGFFVLVLTRLGPGLADKPFNILFLLSEFLPVAFVLIRKPGVIVLDPYVILVAFLGTAMALLCNGGIAIAPSTVGVPLMLMGLLFSLTAKLFLNTSFGFLAANRGIKLSGPYRWVRHPMYAGYFITQAGFLLLNFSTWNLLMLSLAWAFQVMRIIEEEKVLGIDAIYIDYRNRVPYRVIPGLF